MTLKQALELSREEKNLLLETLFRQNLSKEIVASAISDLEVSLKKEDEEVLQKLSILYDRLDQAGC